MVVAHPVEQVSGLRALVRIDRRRRASSATTSPTRSPHRRPVLDRRTHVAEHAAEAGTQPLELLRAGLAVDLDVDQRLGQPVLGSTSSSRPPRPAAAHDRPDHEVDRAAVPGHLHRDRVDEERHVVDHRLDHGVRRLPAVLLDVGV